MISYIKGEVIAVEEGEATIIPRGTATGYLVRGPSDLRWGDRCELWVWPVFSADKGYAFFGFRFPEERRLAKTLATIQGIGPVIAHRVATNMGYDAVVDAIARGDTKALTAGAKRGLGAKSADKLIHGLRASFQTLSVAGVGRPEVQAAMQALVAMGCEVPRDDFYAHAAEHPEADAQELANAWLARLRGPVENTGLDSP